MIHAFDLPARKDLAYSLLSGLILIAVGAVLSINLWYCIFVLAFLVCALGALSQIHLSEARERSGNSTTGSRGLVRGVIVPSALAVVALGFLCFSLLPQKQGMNMTMMPTSFFKNLRERPEPVLRAAGRPFLAAPHQYLARLLPRLQPVHGPPQPRPALRRGRHEGQEPGARAVPGRCLRRAQRQGVGGLYG